MDIENNRIINLELLNFYIAIQNKVISVFVNNILEKKNLDENIVVILNKGILKKVVFMEIEGN